MRANDIHADVIQVKAKLGIICIMVTDFKFKSLSMNFNKFIQFMVNNNSSCKI